MEKRLESIKKEIRSVLISFPKGVSLDEFRRTFKTLLGIRLPTREFGFTLDIDFLHSIPDVVHIQVDKSGTHQLYALADETTTHIQKLVEKQRTVRGKKTFRSKGPTSFNKSFEVNRSSSASTTRCRPFVPAAMRAEIIQVVKLYPDGIGYAPFLMAYQSMFNHAPNFSWLSSNHQERLQQLANAVSELEVKVVGGQEKLHFVGEKFRNGNVSGMKSNLQPFKAVDKATSSTSTYQSQDPNGVLNTSAIPEFVKYNIEKVLKKYPEGILAVHFPILYENFTAKSFDLHELGYNCLLDLVDDLPNIFIRVESPKNENDWILFHVDFSANIADVKKAPVSTNGVPCQKYSRLSHLKEITMVETAPPALQYMQPELSSCNLDQYFPVFISAFINPSLFWFQLQTEDAIYILKKLEKDIEYFYNTQVYGQYRMKDTDVLIGASCVAFLTADNHWYRCVISALLDTENVKVFLVDYGSWETIPRANLYYLKYSFILLPTQAFQAQLALIQPSSTHGKWEMCAQKRFLELCNRVFVMAKVNSMQHQIASILLCDTSGEEDVHINYTLVLEGHAEYTTQKTLDPSDSYPPAKQQSSLNGSALSNHLTSVKQLTEKKSEVENCIENSHSQHISLSNGNQTLNHKHTNSLINKMRELQFSKNRKSVRRILLGDGYHIHIIVVEKEAFMSGEDLCHLLWKDRGANVLACRLEFKEVAIPTVSISKEEYPDLFIQCERYLVGGFNGNESNYSVVLYPLKYSLKVLNVFGHPSLKIRETLSREIKEFNPLALVWMKSEENGEHYEESIDERGNDLDRLCMYDLKTMREGLVCKRLMILANHKENQDETILNKLKEIDSKQNSISKRIEEIEAVCLKYSEEAS